MHSSAAGWPLTTASGSGCPPEPPRPPAPPSCTPLAPSAHPVGALAHGPGPPDSPPGSAWSLSTPGTFLVPEKKEQHKVIPAISSLLHDMRMNHAPHCAPDEAAVCAATSHSSPAAQAAGSAAGGPPGTVSGSVRTRMPQMSASGAGT